MKTYFVYMLTNHNRRLLYVGMTDDLVRRYEEHKNKQYIGFTSKYHIDILAYYEEFSSVEGALAREQQIKKWRREKKNKLIENKNPRWEELHLMLPKKQKVKDAIRYSAPPDKDPSAMLGIKD